MKNKITLKELNYMLKQRRIEYKSTLLPVLEDIITSTQREIAYLNTPTDDENCSMQSIMLETTYIYCLAHQIVTRKINNALPESVDYLNGVKVQQTTRNLIDLRKEYEDELIKLQSKGEHFQ